MTNNEKFRKLFLEYEQLTKNNKLLQNKNLKLWEEVKILKDERINPYYSEYEFLDFCRLCRNKLFHDINEDKYVAFTSEMVDKFANLINQIKNPATVYEKATKTIQTASIKDNVKDVMKSMIDKNYTHIPVYDGDKLIGVFSENILFNYIYKEENKIINSNTTFADIKEYIDLRNSKEIVRFVSMKEPYDNIVNDFIKEFRKGQKLSCIMITENGVIGEKVKGILTTWDIIGR